MEVDWNALAGEAMTQMIRIFVPVLVVLVLKWLTEIWKQLSEKNPELAKLLAYAGQIGYDAAEEYFRNMDATAAEKMDFAIDRAEDYLITLGVKASPEIIHDSVVQYGVSNYKFSWVKNPMYTLIESTKGDGDEEDAEEETEDDRCQSF